jgi:hypothetical protein
MIETKAMGSAGTAVVARYEELVMAEVPHRFHLVLSHRSKWVLDVAVSTIGLAGIAVTAKVRYYDRVVASEIRCDLVPSNMRLRMTMN